MSYVRRIKVHLRLSHQTGTGYLGLQAVGRFTDDNRHFERPNGLDQTLGGSGLRSTGACAVELIDDHNGGMLRRERPQNVGQVVSTQTEILLHLLEVRRDRQSHDMPNHVGGGPVQQLCIGPVVQTRFDLVSQFAFRR